MPDVSAYVLFTIYIYLSTYSVPVVPSVSSQ